MLKPALARGELRAIGATTLNEYRKYIEKDAALERRFQIVYVGEPNVEDTIAILRGLKERYEAHHKVRIKDSAIVAAATLVAPLHLRPLPARQGHRPGRRSRGFAGHPDRLRAGGDRCSWNARATSLEIERAALKRETDPNSKERLQVVERELATLQGAGHRPARALAEGARRHHPHRRAEEADRGAALRDGRADAQGQPGARRRTSSTASCPSSKPS